MVGERCRRVWAKQRWREVNICLSCKIKINPVVRSNLRPGGPRREAVRSLKRVQPAAPTRPLLPLLIGGFESCSQPSAAVPRLRKKSGLRGAVLPGLGGMGTGEGGVPVFRRAWLRSADFVLRSFQIVFPTQGVLGGPGAAVGQKLGLVIEDCGVFSPPRRLLPRALRGTRPPCAPRGLTFAGLRSCSNVPAHTRILVVNLLRNHPGVKNEGFLSKPGVWAAETL